MTSQTRLNIFSRPKASITRPKASQMSNLRDDYDTSQKKSVSTKYVIDEHDLEDITREFKSVSCQIPLIVWCLF